MFDHFGANQRMTIKPALAPEFDGATRVTQATREPTAPTSAIATRAYQRGAKA